MQIGIDIVNGGMVYNRVVHPEFTSVFTVICSKVEFSSQFRHICGRRTLRTLPQLDTTYDSVSCKIIFVKFCARSVAKIRSEQKALRH